MRALSRVHRVIVYVRNLYKVWQIVIKLHIYFRGLRENSKRKTVLVYEFADYVPYEIKLFVDVFLNPLSAETVFIRQILTYEDVESMLV